MFQELSRSMFPPGGWVFVQPQTGWSAPSPTSTTFDQTVELIRKHRLANGAIVQKHNLTTSREAIASELENFTRFRLKMGVSPPKMKPLQALASRAGAVVAEAKKAAVGLSVMADWIGDDLVPASRETAENRAERCVNCPENADPNWVQRLEGFAAEGFHQLMEAKNSMNLRVAQEDKLFACQACNCNLSLKVWVNIEHARKRLRPEHWDRINGVVTRDGRQCWMVTESK